MVCTADLAVRAATNLVLPLVAVPDRRVSNLAQVFLCDCASLAPTAGAAATAGTAAAAATVLPSVGSVCAVIDE